MNLFNITVAQEFILFNIEDKSIFPSAFSLLPSHCAHQLASRIVPCLNVIKYICSYFFLARRDRSVKIKANYEEVIVSVDRLEYFVKAMKRANNCQLNSSQV